MKQNLDNIKEITADEDQYEYALCYRQNNFIYYTMYDDVFSNPFDFAKIKVNDVILDKLRNLANLNTNII